MRLRLVSVGRPRGAVADAAAAYEERVTRYFPFEAVEVREESHRGAGDEKRVVREEGSRLLEKVPEGYRVVALDEGGRRLTSEGLASYLGEARVGGAPGLALLIGGAYGLDGSVLERATLRLSLSDLTLPHDLARLVLAEQLYRAGTILRGEPYHKGSPR
jgi:23S rRNA (pseudouridine1915-N3)-methyltransferase